jgi:dihydrolipoamide dehydrogenase
MAANDGPVPVRTLAHAARLMPEAGQMPRYGIPVGGPAVRYPDLLARVRDVTADVRRHSMLREELGQEGV